MNTYKVERMAENDYNNMMTGSLNYRVEKITVKAENKEEAIALAEKAGYIVNKGYVKTLEELKEIENEKEEARKAREEKEARAKAKKAEREAKKAEEAGLTIEEYRKEQNRKANIRRVEREIAELEKTLEEKKNYLAKLAR